MTECVLCGLPTAHPLFDDSRRAFCCPACMEVDHLLQEQSAPQPTTTDDADLEEANIALGGLWCSSCAWLVGETLQRSPGVQTADVSFVQREARITYDPARTNPKRWLKQVRRLGYRAWFVDDDPPYDEEEAHFNRLLAGGVFAMHIMLISVMLYIRQWVGGAPPETAWLANIFHIMIFAASIPLLFILGIPILRAGVASLVRGRPNMHTLIALGAFSAWGLSLRNLIVGLDRVYFDTAAMLLFLVTLGRWFEIQARKSSNEAVERLWRQIPDEASWITADGERRVPVEQLTPGARIRVRPGERFPVDGLVAIGEGDVDESLLTGEPLPVTRGPSGRVFAGTVSMDGAFEVVTTAVGSETMSGQIGRLLHQALWDRAPVERLADKLAAWMVPLAIAIAGGTFAFWTARAGPEIGLLHALSVLLIACPCALGIATPLTLWVGLGRSAEAGVIVRGAGVLERLTRVRHLFFDKTGTLTRPELTLQAIASNGLHEEVFLSRVAAVEKLSEHPVGEAILTSAREKALSLADVEDFRVWAGQGVSGRLGDATLWVGNERLMTGHGQTILPEMASTAEKWRQRGLSVVYAGWDGHTTGLLALGEQARPETVEAVDTLKALGLQVSVLTGDDAAAGERWADLLGVPVYAEQHPEDKLSRLQDISEPAAMVGDGINDGPALAAASVGFTVGRGTDVARAAADVVLLNDDLRAIPWLVGLSREALKRVRQNLAWAFFYNLVGLALAVSGLLQPVLAALAMVISSLLVIGNALRLRRTPLYHTQEATQSVT